MSLDKAIRSGKEKRKEYRGAKAVDRTCRNHGDCPWCASGRMYKTNRAREASEQRMKEYEG